MTDRQSYKQSQYLLYSLALSARPNKEEFTKNIEVNNACVFQIDVTTSWKYDEKILANTIDEALNQQKKLLSKGMYHIVLYAHYTIIYFKICC